MSAEIFAARVERARAVMRARGIDALMLSVGRDLPYLVGYDAMPLERLTMLVVPRDAPATMVVPRLEEARVTPIPDVFTMRPWSETEDPVAIVAGLVRGAATIAVGDTMWARFLVDLLHELPSARFVRGVEVMGPLRVRKDAAEVAALEAAGAAADSVARQLQAGEIALVGRTEAEVSADIARRLLDAGHQKVNFAIVAAGANAASPHHHAGATVIERGDIVLCDFGGTMDGYCSDITRCVHLGPAPGDIADAYAVLLDAQRSAVAAASIGVPCEEVDTVARDIISAAGYGELFIHRTGHGIGMDEHEDPYMVQGNDVPLAAGHAFSVEPGIYLPGRWGMRLEDCVVATPQGPLPLTHADHGLVELDA